VRVAGLRRAPRPTIARNVSKGRYGEIEEEVEHERRLSTLTHISGDAHCHPRRPQPRAPAPPREIASRSAPPRNGLEINGDYAEIPLNRRSGPAAARLSKIFSVFGPTLLRVSSPRTGGEKNFVWFSPGIVLYFSAPRWNVNKISEKMRLKSRNFNRYTPKVATYYSANRISQPRSTDFGFFAERRAVFR
jgi:hypothetical protein